MLQGGLAGRVPNSFVGRCGHVGERGVDRTPSALHGVNVLGGGAPPPGPLQGSVSSPSVPPFLGCRGHSARSSPRAFVLASLLDRAGA